MAQRDKKTGRFLAGNIGGGRKPGSRNKLSEAFIVNVQASWEKHGAEVLERVAREEPGSIGGNCLTFPLAEAARCL